MMGRDATDAARRAAPSCGLGVVQQHYRYEALRNVGMCSPVAMCALGMWGE